MTYKNIKLAIEDGIAHLILARPDNFNAFSGMDMLDEICDAIESVNGNDAARVLLLSAEGKHFSAGGDLNEMREKYGQFSGSTVELQDRYSLEVQRLPRLFHRLRIPSIAAVQGAAMGTGCNMTYYCDFTIASTKARFCESFINLGILPGAGGAWFLPRRIGPQRAAEMILTGRMVDGAEAKEIGLALDCVAPDELMPRAMELARRIASRPPATVRRAKTLIRQSLESSLDGLLDLTAAQQAILHGTEDHLTAVQAFLDKDDAPVFTGR
ncbi:MAG: enoyl-CoA hydratase-related protein [Alphaproteobacteria bacterium]